MSLLELLRAAVVLPLLLVLPGVVVLAGLPHTADRDARSSGVVEALWRAMIASVVLTGWIGVLLAELGIFRLRWLVLLVVAASLAMWWASGRRWPVLRSATRADIAPVALVVLSLALFARPHETILGGADAGVYVNTAANLVRTGALVVREPTLAALAPEDARMFLQTAPEAPGTPLRFPGFYVVDQTRGESLPQFLPLHTVWLAIPYTLAGLWGALWAMPVWGTLGVLSVYFAGRWALGGDGGRDQGAGDRGGRPDTGAAVVWPAFIGAVGLAVTATQVWFSRYTTSEALTQALLWAGVAAFGQYAARGPQGALRPGRLAGLALGGVLLTRIDTPFVLLLPVGLALWPVLRPGRGGVGAVWTSVRDGAVFFVPVTGLALHAAAHALLFTGPYVQGTLRVLPQIVPLLGLGLAVVVGGLGIAALVGRRGTRTWGSGADTAARARSLLAVGIVALGVWAYFVRPLIGQPLQWSNWYSGAVVAYPHLSLVQVGWYLSPVGVVLGVVGAALAAWRAPARRIWLVLGVGLFFAVLYLANPINNPRHIYVMRRYLPAVLPAFVLFAGYALMWLAGTWRGGAGRAALWRPIAALVLGAAALAGILPTTAQVMADAELRGAVAGLTSVADRLEPAAVLVFADPEAVGIGAALGTPLTFVYGREALILRGAPEAERLAGLVRGWQAQGRPVYFVAGERPMPLALPGVTLAPVDALTLTLPTLESAFEHAPRRWLTLTLPVEIYRATPGRPTGPVSVDVGTADSLAVVGGLHGREAVEELTYRWTDGGATLQVTAPAEARRVVLRLAARGPEATPVEVTVDGRTLGRVEVRPGFAEYRLDWPGGATASGAAVVGLLSPTFEAPDGRRLGVQVDWLRVE